MTHTKALSNLINLISPETLEANEETICASTKAINSLAELADIYRRNHGQQMKQCDYLRLLEIEEELK